MNVLRVPRKGDTQVDERPIEQLTLRDLFGNSEWLIRELSEHLEQSFLPRIRAVDQLVQSHSRPAERNEIPDSTVRSRVAAMLASDDFSQKLFSKLEAHLTAIDERSQRAVQQQETQ
jgi:hypothetical protein